MDEFPERYKIALNIPVTEEETESLLNKTEVSHKETLRPWLLLRILPGI